MPQMQGNVALEISLDFQFGPIPAIFSAHAPEKPSCCFIREVLLKWRERYTYDMLHYILNATNVYCAV